MSLHTFTPQYLLPNSETWINGTTVEQVTLAHTEIASWLKLYPTAKFNIAKTVNLPVTAEVIQMFLNTSGSLQSTLSAIASAADESRKNSEEYKQGIANANSYSNLLRQAEFETTAAILRTCDYIEAHSGKPINSATFEFLFELPALYRVLEKEIERTEGRACCADKAYDRLAAHLGKLIG